MIYLPQKLKVLISPGETKGRLLKGYETVLLGRRGCTTSPPPPQCPFTADAKYTGNLLHACWLKG